MRKILFTLCLLFVVLVYNNSSVEAAAKFKIVEEDGEKVLVKYKGDAGKVNVPNGVTVVKGAFKKNSKIKTIILPDTVKIIEEDSFSELKNLKKVQFSKKLKMIEKSAFFRCPKVKKIVIPKSCKKIGNYAFRGCLAAKKISVAKGNKYFKVYKGALYNKKMTKLIYYPRKSRENKTFIIPKSVKVVLDTAFTDNCYIEKMVVKGDVQDGYDEGGSCTGMKKLKCVVFKTKQTNNHPLRFSDCKKLEEVKLAEGTEKIVYEQFSNCSNLIKINFPDSIKSIVDNAFDGCDRLVLPEFDESIIKHID